MKFYSMVADPCDPEYVELATGGVPRKLVRAVQLDEYQYIPRELKQLELSEESGDILPDFLFDPAVCVPLISTRFKRILDQLNVDYLYSKRFCLVRKSDAICEDFWLASPPRIHCLNKAESKFSAATGCAVEIAINEEKIGFYQMFRIADTTNSEIIVTQELADILRKQNLTGVYFNEINAKE